MSKAGDDGANFELKKHQGAIMSSVGGKSSARDDDKRGDVRGFKRAINQTVATSLWLVVNHLRKRRSVWPPRDLCISEGARPSVAAGDCSDCTTRMKFTRWKESGKHFLFDRWLSARILTKALGSRAETVRTQTEGRWWGGGGGCLMDCQIGKWLTMALTLSGEHPGDREEKVNPSRLGVSSFLPD